MREFVGFSSKKTMAHNSPTPSPAHYPIVFCHGELVPASEVRISPFDAGIETGHGIFETLKAIDGEPFATTRHFYRLAHAAKIMRLTTPDEAELTRIMKSVLDANGLKFARVRVTITGGNGGQLLIVSALGIPTYTPHATVITAPFTRNECGALVNLKTTSYGENVVAQKLMAEAGVDEAIFANTAGNLCEGSRTNVFAVIGGKLITPPIESGCLPGVTRALTIKLAHENGIECAEQDFTISDLKGADEAFLTSSLRDIQPIESVDGQEIPRPEGGVTDHLKTLFSEMVAADKNP